MTLKNTALFALIGMALLTILLTVNLINVVTGVAGGFVPAMTLLVALIQWLASLSVFLFFVVFHRAQ